MKIGDYVKIEELEKYRNTDGYINMDLFEKENTFIKMPEVCGSQNREKFWIPFENGNIMIRTSNLDKENVEYTNYAELIFEELAKQVDMPCAHYDLITYKGEKGVYTKNVLEKQFETLIHAKSLLEQTETQDNYDLTSSIDDVFKSYEIFAKYDDISKGQIGQLCKDTAKMAIFDTYLMSTDRHPENFGTIFYSNGSEKSIRLSPMFDNECSLMLDKPMNEIDEMMGDYMSLKTKVSLQNQFIVIPESERDESYWDWQDTLYYLCDESEFCMEFAEKCSSKLNIKQAMEDVEKRIQAPLPEKLKLYAAACFECRRNMINKTLCIDEVERW